jgi:hypothetical protein
VLVACGRLPRRWLVAAVAAVSVWPVSDLVQQVVWVADRTTGAAYYQSLADALRGAQERAGPASTGERVEVVDTINHGASLHLAASASLARGWDRQADNAYNPIFYRKDALTADSYHDWLHGLAVGWVAVPSTSLDYAGVREARLIGGGLSYLLPVWSNPDWKLYRVADAAPLAVGASVRSVSPSAVTFTTSGPADVHLKVRWTAYLRLVDATTRMPVDACIADVGGWTQIHVPRRGSFSVTSPFELDARFRSVSPDCTTDRAAH